MFKVIDLLGHIHNAYGAFPDEDGDIQFILCDAYGSFYATHMVAGYYKLYESEVE